MAADVTLSVIFPSYLEEENLRQILPRLGEVLVGLCVKSEVLGIATLAPMDNTRAVCEEQGVTYLNRERGNS